MDKRALGIYLIILSVLCGGLIAVAMGSGQMGYVQGYMMTPAIAAIITRLFFYKPHFKDANLRFGKIKDYGRFWLYSLGITALSSILYTVTGSISWDFTGASFLDRLSAQFVAAGQDITAGLPAGWTPQTMMWVYFFAALTVFNIFPGVVTGFGEEFGHRGFMFPQLYRIRPWVGIIIGGLLWYAWHLPLALVAPQPEYPLWQILLNGVVVAIGSVATFTYLAYVYVKSGSVFVAAVAHITMNNSAAASSVFITVQNQMLANLGLTLTMLIVVAILYYKKELKVFANLGSEGQIITRAQEMSQ